MKICSKCKIKKDESCFGKNEGSLISYCKQCKSHYDKKYRDKNRGIRAQKQKEYYVAHKKEYAEKCRIYKQKRREQVREQYKNFINAEPSTPLPEFAMGVYRIRNVVNGKFYIGSTVLFSDRKSKHFINLRAGKHENSRLQSAFDKYSENAFVFEVVEIVSHEDQLIPREQHYLDTLKPFGKIGYNISKIAGEPGNRGVKSIKTFTFKDPQGNIITVTNLAQFCRDNNLDGNRMRAMLRGKILTWKGYSSLAFNKIDHEYKLKDPQGKNHVTNNIEQFAKEHSLDPSCLFKVLRGKLKKHHGWMAVDFLGKSVLQKMFMAPDKTIHVVTTDFIKWCKAQGLNYNLMAAVHRGAMQNHKGWTKAQSTINEFDSITENCNV